jgi:hypothetical protein
MPPFSSRDLNRPLLVASADYPAGAHGVPAECTQRLQLQLTDGCKPGYEGDTRACHHEGCARMAQLFGGYAWAKHRPLVAAGHISRRLRHQVGPVRLLVLLRGLEVGVAVGAPAEAVAVQAEALALPLFLACRGCMTQAPRCGMEWQQGGLINTT